MIDVTREGRPVATVRADRIAQGSRARRRRNRPLRLQLRDHAAARAGLEFTIAATARAADGVHDRTAPRRRRRRSRPAAARADLRGRLAPWAGRRPGCRDAGSGGADRRRAPAGGGPGPDRGGALRPRRAPAAVPGGPQAAARRHARHCGRIAGDRALVDALPLSSRRWPPSPASSSSTTTSRRSSATSGCWLLGQGWDVAFATAAPEAAADGRPHPALCAAPRAVGRDPSLRPADGPRRDPGAGLRARRPRRPQRRLPARRHRRPFRLGRRHVRQGRVSGGRIRRLLRVVVSPSRRRRRLSRRDRATASPLRRSKRRCTSARATPRS